MPGIRSLGAALSAGLLASVALGGAAEARAPLPRQLQPTFTDRLTSPVVVPAGQSACKVQITGLTDGRRAPDIVAVLGGMAIRSPPDTTAWLKLVMSGLNARGFAVEFVDGPAAATDAVQMKVSLQTAWLSTATTNFLATVVLHVAAVRSGGASLDHDYRGSKVTMNWLSGDGEMQRVIDYAFTESLNAMTGDLLALCAAPGGAAPVRTSP